jgi:trans-L-3-hydroxyproline dehydratase
MIRCRTVDAHVGGAPLRLVTEGAPSPRGSSMREKTAWVSRHADHVRQMLMLEPRGHRDMTGAMLTEPVTPGAHAGLIFMNADGYAPMSGHGVMAVTALALHHGLIVSGGDSRLIVYDTIAGVVRTRASVDEGGAVTRVAFTNVPSFVLQGGVTVKAGGRRARADVAFGGAFYAIVDAESVGLSVDLRHLPVLRRLAREIVDAVESVATVVHPLDAGLAGLAGAVFTGPPGAGPAHLRSLTVLTGGAAGRSASGTGMSAVMAVLDAMGLLVGDAAFEQEGILGARFSGRIAGRTMAGSLPAIVPEIDGSAWPTGEHLFLANPADPFAQGALV